MFKDRRESPQTELVYPHQVMEVLHQCGLDNQMIQLMKSKELDVRLRSSESSKTPLERLTDEFVLAQNKIGLLAKKLDRLCEARRPKGRSFTKNLCLVC